MQRNVRFAGESVQKFCKLDIAKLESFLLTLHYNFEGKTSYCKNMLNFAQKVANSTPENLAGTRKSRNFACRKGEIPQIAKKPIKHEKI